MANVAHATLTGADLHEPKGIATATAGQTYIANGAGSGAWTTVSGLSITGMIADFVTPIAPTGWLECDGSNVSRTTYSALFAAITIQQSGTRSAGTAVITGLSDTSGMRAGYPVGGTGISVGSTILSVDTATQITISSNALSSGTNTVIVSPWALGDGSTTFTLPDVTSAGRFRRSRTASTSTGPFKVGDIHASRNVTHSHTGTATGTTGSAGSHTHTASDSGHVHGNSLNESPHSHTINSNTGAAGGSSSLAVCDSTSNNTGVAVTTSVASTGITITNATASANVTLSTAPDHTHAFTSNVFTTSAGSVDGFDARPYGLVVLTCVKT